MTPNDPEVGPTGQSFSAWGRRSPIPAAMLNPSALALVLAGASVGYSSEASTDMPWELGFIASPLVLHRGSRLALPTKISTHIPAWISRNPELRTGFPARAASLIQPIQEAIRFGVRNGILSFDGSLLHSEVKIRRTGSVEMDDLMKKARFIGRWFTKLDQPSTAYVLFGVKV